MSRVGQPYQYRSQLPTDQLGAADSGTLSRLLLVSAGTAGFMLLELVAGYLSGSLALLADAGHMFSDLAALFLAVFAQWYTTRPPTPQRSYGYYRAEILAALANGVALVLVALLVLYEAWQRLHEPREVTGLVMVLVGVTGLLVNLFGLVILNGGRSQNLNVRGAWLHIFGDALGSVGVIVAAGLIGLFGWYAADPIAGAVIAVLILISAFRLIRDAVEILMEAVPRHIDLLEVRDTLRQQPGVADVHDLHIWTLASGFVALSAHVVTPYVQGEDIRRLLVNLRQLLHDRYGISHTTLQLETPSIPEDDTRFCQGDPRCLP
ncbi:MAG: cation transporter [Chloroflexota bacterium]